MAAVVADGERFITLIAAPTEGSGAVFAIAAGINLTAAGASTITPQALALKTITGAIGIDFVAGLVGAGGLAHILYFGIQL